MSDGMKRRDFLKVVGVAGAGAATAGCSTGEVERLIPYVVPAEEIVPGVPTWYTTTCRECPGGCGLHVETHSGRATKVEGNPDHPISHGNTCARGQSSVQGLYHPDRYQGPQIVEPGVRSTNVSWMVAEQQLADRIRALRDAGRANRIVFLTGDYTGSMDQLADGFVRSVGARRVIYNPFGEQPRFVNFADADLLISFGADFLETWGSPVDYTWQFTQMRDHRIGTRGKFVWIAPHRPMTGLSADQWLAPRPGTEAIVAQGILGQVDAATVEQQTGVPAASIEWLRNAYAGARKPVALGPGPSYVGPNHGALLTAIDGINARSGMTGANRAGGTAQVLQLAEQMRAGQVDMILMAADVNPVYTLPGGARFAEALERVPVRVSFSTFPDESSLYATLLLPDHHFLESWDDYVPQPGTRLLVQPTMRPVYNTKQTGDVLLGVARGLGIESVAAGIQANTFYQFLQANWAATGGGDWRDAVIRGGRWAGSGVVEPSGPTAGTTFEGEANVAPSALPPLTAAPLAAPAHGATGTAPDAHGAVPHTAAEAAPPRTVLPTAVPTDGRFNLVVYPSYRFFDGRTANRPWLLELGDPVTKVSWESWVELHPRAAVALGVEQGDIVQVESPYGSVTTYAYVYPGVRPDTVAIQMGLGHEAFGRFTEGRGVNPNRLLGTTADPVTGNLAPYGAQVVVRKVGEKNPPQGLFEGGVRVQYDREIAPAVSLAHLAALQNAAAAPHIPGESDVIETLRGSGGFVPIPSETDPSAYPPPGTKYGQYVEGATRWAMNVDLNRCIGCGACVTACYAENNIPVVGPTQLKKGRELSWLRIERYFDVTREEDDAYADGATDDVRFLPMMCQHCGNAPCEPVCPVYAAYHTPEGLNAQVYNRCVGTRYCANNCPYKVRYYNWFTYDFVEPLNWQLNPDVSVREKGVMEKCTFCVQRIHQAERDAALENRPTRDGEVIPACAQACPAEVFTFGNIANPDSAVAKASASVRSYRVLDVLNVQPAVVYLKKVTLHEPAVGGHHAEAVGEVMEGHGAEVAPAAH